MDYIIMQTMTKTTTEGLIQLDIRQISRNIQIGNSGIITWNKQDVSIAQIQFHVLTIDSIAINYHKLMDREWIPITETLHLDSTQCHLGGDRYWFSCPDCLERKAILYLIDSKFNCRQCHNLTYQSQNETVNERQWRKARKIRSKLGASNSLLETTWEKPKGMHYSKFKELKEKEMDLYNTSPPSQLNN
jgi:hypothetical protein